MADLYVALGIVLVVFLFTKAMGNPMGHSGAYMRRRAFNWVPLGVTYALLYMGRYNLTVAKLAFGEEAMPREDFGLIFGAGTITYAFAFLINGPLTDKIGGRKAMLIAAAGATVANGAMGLVTFLEPKGSLVLIFSVMYSLNMYFQSFGAVSIVKVNSHWFHVRERGMFGGIFGIIISAGIFLAFQVGGTIVDLFHTTTAVSGIWMTGPTSLPVMSFATVTSPPYWVFWIPSGLLLVFLVINYLVVQDNPKKANLENIETGDASSGEDDTPDPVLVILKKVVTNPIVLTIGLIEFCTGVLRQGVMHWYPMLAKDLGYYKTFFVTDNWGTMLFIAGATGGMTAGWISDKVFGSRRAPVAGLLYGLMALCVVVMIFGLSSPWVLGACVFLVSYCVIGTHGMLSGTASMDFGGRKNVGTAVGLIDGLVYLGTGVQSVCLGYLTKSEKGWTFGGYFTQEQAGWSLWPVFLLPFAIIGTILAIRIWKAIPEAAKRKS